MCTLLFSCLLSLIIIGSSTAFNILISLGNISLYCSYIIVIGCVLRKRLVGEPLLTSQFDLGRAGIFVNSIAFIYLAVAIVFIPFPSAPNPTLIAMNWSSLMFGCLVIFSVVYYYFKGRHNYEGPVEYIEKVEQIMGTQ
jgi:choline transport protein